MAVALAVGLAVGGGVGGFGFGGVAAIWAYDREALAAADATVRAEVATCWAWSALALALRMAEWISSSFLVIANRIRS